MDQYERSMREIENVLRSQYDSIINAYRSIERTYLRLAEFIRFRDMTDDEFLRVKPPKEGEPEVYPKMWRREFNRRFLLRPLEVRPNTQDGETLLRAVG